MALDMAKLNLGEISLIEDLTGVPYDEAMSEGKPKGKALAALGMIAKRRELLAQGKLPEFTWNDAQELTFDDVAELLGWNTAEEITEDSDGDDPKDSSQVSKTTSRTRKAQ